MGILIGEEYSPRGISSYGDFVLAGHCPGEGIGGGYCPAVLAKGYCPGGD